MTRLERAEGSKVQGARCKVQCARCKVQGAGCRVQGARCKVQGARCKVQGARFKVYLCRSVGEVKEDMEGGKLADQRAVATVPEVTKVQSCTAVQPQDSGLNDNKLQLTSAQLRFKKLQLISAPPRARQTTSCNSAELRSELLLDNSENTFTLFPSIHKSDNNFFYHQHIFQLTNKSTNKKGRIWLLTVCL